jgi:NAD dependent epimerase/dehydratase family enzyme
MQPGGAWEAALDGADAVVNLAGESVAGLPWTPARKRGIRESRLRATRAIVGALAPEGRPRVLVNGSAVGYYGDSGDRPLPETALAGHDFLASVVVDWEAAARQASCCRRRAGRSRRSPCPSGSSSAAPWADPSSGCPGFISRMRWD